MKTGYAGIVADATTFVAPGPSVEEIDHVVRQWAAQDGTRVQIVVEVLDDPDFAFATAVDVYTGRPVYERPEREVERVARALASAIQSHLLVDALYETDAYDFTPAQKVR